MKKVMLLLLFGGILFSATAQEVPLKVSGELRLRSEADGRDFSTDSPMNLYTLSRLRLGLEIKPSDVMTVFVRIQDSRTFGEETSGGNFSTVTNMRNVDLYEGYVVVQKFFTNDLTVKFGRQVMQFGNERIIGALNWSNIGRSFDGVRFTYLPSTSSALDMFIMNAGETNSTPSGVNVASVAHKRDDGQLTAGAFYSAKSGESMMYEGYALYQNITKRIVPGKDSLVRGTLGGRVKGKTSSFLYDVEATTQLGTMNGTDIFAYMAAVSIGYEVGSPIISAVSAHFDMLSGTAPTATENNTFEPPFATGHKFYGFMDYFTNVYTQIFSRGLYDLHIRSQHKISDDLTLTPTLHYFTLAERRTAAISDTFLGTELDMIANYRYNKNLSFEFGVCGFVPGPIMRTAYGKSDVGIWSYITTAVSF